MSSYIEHFVKSSRDLAPVITESLEGIKRLDHAVEGMILLKLLSKKKGDDIFRLV
jgi:hypothetical protein